MIKEEWGLHANANKVEEEGGKVGGNGGSLAGIYGGAGLGWAAAAQCASFTPCRCYVYCVECCVNRAKCKRFVFCSHLFFFPFFFFGLNNSGVFVLLLICTSISFTFFSYK